MGAHSARPLPAPHGCRALVPSLLQMMQVAVPPGVSAGQTIMIATPAGQQLQVAVPAPAVATAVAVAVTAQPVVVAAQPVVTVVVAK